MKAATRFSTATSAIPSGGCTSTVAPLRLTTVAVAGKGDRWRSSSRSVWLTAMAWLAGVSSRDIFEPSADTVALFTLTPADTRATETASPTLKSSNGRLMVSFPCATRSITAIAPSAVRSSTSDRRTVDGEVNAARTAGSSSSTDTTFAMRGRFPTATCVVPVSTSARAADSVSSESAILSILTMVRALGRRMAMTSPFCTGVALLTSTISRSPASRAVLVARVVPKVAPYRRRVVSTINRRNVNPSIVGSATCGKNAGANSAFATSQAGVCSDAKYRGVSVNPAAEVSMCVSTPTTRFRRPPRPSGSSIDHGSHGVLPLTVWPRARRGRASGRAFRA